MIEKSDGATFEDAPLTRAEYITALSHLYRGELQRSLSWRIRLDTTTNWAIVASVGILTFAFNNPAFAPQTLILGMYANLLFLLLESQRFRFFDVYRARVRMIEENFYGPMLRRDLVSPMAGWGMGVADDLLHPRFHLTMRQAVRARLTRIYMPLYGAQLVGWLTLVAMQHRQRGESWLDLLQIGRLPGWVSLVLVGGLFGFLVVTLLTTPQVISLPEFYESHTGTRAEDVPELDT